MSEKQPIETQRVSVIVTKRCTLKCKLCGALSPYIENYHPTIDFLRREVDAFFRIVDKTGIIDISGGEPMLRANSTDFVLGELLQYLADHYSGRFEHLRIFTNGTVVPGQEICNLISHINKKQSFSITVDHYGKYSAQVKETVKRLKDAQIDFVVRDYFNDVHCGGWVDLRDISLKNPESEQAKKLYEKCAIPQKLGCCLELMDGIMSPCSVAAARYLCGESEKDEADIIDLFDDERKMQEKLRMLLSADCFPSCHYCVGGLSDDSIRVTPAEQATAGDIQAWKEQYNMRV